MTTEVFLSQLIEGGDINSRAEMNRDEAIDRLTNSILQFGLLQPLSIKVEGEKYRVIDGNRRLRAITRLQKEGRWPEEKTIPVLVRAGDDADAREASLAANVERVQLHPVDEYEAFAAIADQGTDVADIAERFGLTERQVKQRLALGKLIPEVRADYRADKLDIRLIRGLANLDHATQRQLYVEQELRGWQLSDAMKPASDSYLMPDSELARFVGRERYEAEGGSFITDLFIEPEEQKWANPPLAVLLAAKKSDELCAQLVADGWSFAERRDTNWLQPSEYPQGKVDKKKFTDKENFKRWKELDKAIAGYGELDDEDLEYSGLLDERAEIEEHYHARDWSAEQKARLGVVILSDYDIVYGVAPEPEAVEPEEGDGEESDKPTAEKPKEDPGLSMALLEELSGHFTRASQAAIADDPFFAKVLLIDELWERKRQPGYVPRKLSMDYQEYRNPRIDGVCTHGREAVDDIAKKAGVYKAKSFAGRVKAWSKLEDGDLDRVLAWLVSQSLVGQRPTGELGAYLMETGRTKILEHWQPTVENFFNKLTAAQLHKLIEDEKIAVPPVMKKAELAAYVRDKLPETWLPKEITG